MIENKNGQRRLIFRLVSQAFMSNRQAKITNDMERKAHYRAKDAAINTLLRLGYAVVDLVDWSKDDPIIGIRFTGGGKLHIKLSCLDRDAFRAFRRQINGQTAEAGPVDEGAESQAA